MGGDATRRLGIAIARRDTATVAALAAEAASRFGSPLASLRLALASAAIGIQVSRDDRWAAIDRRRVDAATALGRPARVIRSGSTPFLLGQAIPIVEATLAATRGYFIVDTGAPHSALSRSWCERSGIRLAQDVLHSIEDGSGREIEAAAVRVDSIDAGGLSVDVPAVLFEFPKGLDVAGILSPLDAFPGATVMLDYVERRLVVGGEPPAIPGTPLYWEGGVPLVHARIADNDAFLLLDSGAGGELLCEQFADRFEMGALSESATISAAGTLPIRTGLRLPLAVGGEDPRQHPFALKDCVATGSDTSLIGRDGFLGGGWMAGRRLSVDADRLTLRFSAKHAGGS